MAEGPAFIELRVQPSIELISIVRRFVTAFYDEILNDPDATSRIALATHELLENAVKYSTDNSTTLSIEVTRGESARLVTVKIRNVAQANHVERLEALFREMRASSDAADFYQKTMRKNAHRSDGSGLGLARIRAEAEMDLSYELEGGHVVIVAHATVPIPQRPSRAFSEPAARS
jgi:hypothetical protein